MIGREQHDVRVRRVAGLLCAVLCAVLWLGGCRADAPAPPAGQVADAESPPELVEMMQELLPRVERLAGLDRVEPLRMRWQDRAAARTYVEARLDSELPPERLDGVRRTYAALGLIPDTLDLRALLLDLYTEQVLGYYDPRSTTLYVLEGEQVQALRPVLAHELVHALQDQHTNLDSLVAHERGNDRQTAAHAALEGHAMVVMFAVLAEEATRRRIDPVTLPNPAAELGEALAAQTEAFPVFQRAPAVIRQTLLFPYVRGSDFVYRLWSSMAGAGRYPAPLDTLLPQSTAQVLHPVERFVQQRVEPVELRFAAPPDGWHAVYDNTFGQLETAIFLGEHLGTAAAAAARGWAGDRYLLVSDGAGTDVLHWVSVWENEAAADRFAEAVRGAAGRRPLRRVSVTREPVAGSAGVWIADMPAAVAPARAGRAPLAPPQEQLP